MKKKYNNHDKGTNYACAICSYVSRRWSSALDMVIEIDQGDWIEYYS